MRVSDLKVVYAVVEKEGMQQVESGGCERGEWCVVSTASREAEPAVASDAVDRQPCCRVDVEAARDEICRLGRHADAGPERRAPAELGVGWGRKGRLAGEEDVEQDAERPDLGFARSVRAAGEDLGRGVRRRAVAGVKEQMGSSAGGWPVVG
jgi:hypothetical protein